MEHEILEVLGKMVSDILIVKAAFGIYLKLQEKNGDNISKTILKKIQEWENKSLEELEQLFLDLKSNT